MAPMIASPHGASRSGEGSALSSGAEPEGTGPIGRLDGRRINSTPDGQAAARAVVSPIDSQHESSSGNRNACRATSAGPNAGQHPSGGAPTAQEQTAPPAAPTLSPPGWPGPLRLAGNGLDRQLACRVLQSPLAGVSDRIFRNLVRRWAPEALLFTEMVNATSLELGHGRDKVEELALEAGPIGVQLFDHRPEAMAEAARRAEASGAFLIDINMGCPVRKIARKGGGSGLLRDPELAMRIVAAVAGAVRIPVTVKTRLGWCGPSADPVGFALGLQNAGARALTLHGRTREQGFQGQADWAAIARVKRALTIPLIANGDVSSPEEALRCLALTGADGVMVGRGTMGAPWLVGRIDAALRGQPVPPIPDASQRLALAAEQLEALLETRGERGLLIARKHLGWTCQGFAGAAELRHGLMRAGTPEATRELLTQAAERLGSSRP
jgi:tRNA-dihydrouridine synthase B